jgi:uncharacterized protein YbjT (DUF2867 family)
MELPVLVLGATGGQGGAVHDALRVLGIPRRALTRRPDSDSARRLAASGTEVVCGDLTEVAVLTEAMSGVAAVFAVTTPFEAGAAAEVEQGRAVVAAAAAAAVPHLVFSSVAGADRHSGVPHFESKARIEELLAGSGLSHTVLAPTYFFDNALGGEPDIRAGRLALPLSVDHRLQQLAYRDLGLVAARAITEPDRYAGRRLELAGDEPTPAEMAETLGHVLGRTVGPVEIGVSEVGSSDMRAMWRFLAGAGYQADLPALRAEFPDLAWTSFRDWARAAFAQPQHRDIEEGREPR